MQFSRRKRTLAAALGCAIMVISFSAGSVLAGEVTGTGEPVPTQGLSWCRFSGLNDKVEGEGPVEPMAQSYGIEVKLGLVPHPSVAKGTFLSPGTACNPQRTFLPPLR